MPASILVRSFPSLVIVGEVFQVRVFVGSGRSAVPLAMKKVQVSVGTGTPTTIDADTFFAKQAQPNYAALASEVGLLIGTAPPQLDVERA